MRIIKYDFESASSASSAIPAQREGDDLCKSHFIPPEGCNRLGCNRSPKLVEALAAEQFQYRINSETGASFARAAVNASLLRDDRVTALSSPRCPLVLSVASLQQRITRRW